MRPGISSFAFGWAIGSPSTPAPQAFGVDALLDFAIQYGIRVIQIGDNLPLHVLTGGELDGLALRARAHGIEIEVGARGLSHDHLHHHIDIARRLHANLLRFVIDARNHEPAPDEAVRLMRGALPALRAAGVILGIENHDRFPSAVLRRMVDTVASEHVGICLDTVNSLGAGEGIGEVLGQLAPVCVNLHVKDFSIERLSHQMGFTVSGRSLGKGMLPIDIVLAAVTKQGRCNTAIVETWTPPEQEMSATIAKEARWAVESVMELRAALERNHEASPDPTASHRDQFPTSIRH